MLRRIFRLIPKDKRGRGILVGLLVPVRSVLNLLGIASIIPALLLILDDSSKYPWLSDHTPLVLCAIMLFVVLKGLLNIALVRHQSRYLLSLYRYFSTSVFKILYSKGLQYLKGTNTASVAWEINGLCYNVSTGYLSSCFSLWGEVIFNILLLASIAAYSPFSTLVIVCGLAPIVAIYFRFVKGKLYNLGKDEFEERKAQHKRVQNVFRGYSEMRISNAFEAENSKFEESISKIIGYRMKGIVIGAIPSMLLEIAAIFIIGAIVVLNISFSDNSMRVFLGVFAVALMRMIPSIRSIISAYSNIHSSKYSIDTIEQYMQSYKAEENALQRPVSEVKGAPVISVEGLGFKFDDSEKPLFAGLSFDVQEGEILGIQGRSGSGKTTLFNILLGLFPSTEGTVKVWGDRLSCENVASWHNHIGYVPQEVFIDDNLTLQENIALGYSEIDPVKMRKAIEQAELSEVVASLPKGLDSVLGECGSKISGGQKQRIGIARALYKEARVLFFDEATSNLDSQTEKDIDEAVLSLKKTNLTILIISHRDSSLEICDRIINL